MSHVCVGAGFGGFALILVLFILLVIIGAGAIGLARPVVC